MGTATSRKLLCLSLLLILSAPGCGSNSSSTSHAGATASAGEPASHALNGLAPAQVPNGWKVARIPDGATIPYPPGWRVIRGDRGTATAALLDAGHQYLGYLNLTPRQADETLAGWAAFRVHHNAEEGERNLRTLASRTAVRIRGGRGSCVEDAYRTAVGTSYIEIACLVAGKHTTVVVVGAAAPGSFARVAPMLEAAISAATA